MSDQKDFVVIVPVDADNDTNSYGVVSKEDYDKWCAGDIPLCPDLMAFMYSDLGYVKVVGTWAEAQSHVHSRVGGQIVDVQGAIAY